MSPRHQTSAAALAEASASTASKACLLPWMSETTATRTYPAVSVMARRLQLPVALAAAVVVAEAAVLLLRPRDGIITPADVRAASYFTQTELQRATDFRSGQLALYGARVAIELGVLVVAVQRPPRWLRRSRRP